MSNVTKLSVQARISMRWLASECGILMWIRGKYLIGVTIRKQSGTITLQNTNDVIYH